MKAGETFPSTSCFLKSLRHRMRGCIILMPKAISAKARERGDASRQHCFILLSCTIESGVEVYERARGMAAESSLGQSK